MTLTKAQLHAMNKPLHAALHPAGDPPQARAHSVLEGAWVVSQETIHGPIMTTFQGPCAEWRARQYARAVVLEQVVDNVDCEQGLSA